MRNKMTRFMAVILILSISVIGYAAGNIEKIEASLAHDMGFLLDGKEWQPIDLDGTKLSPIIYKGRSYVPVRALLSELDAEVDYDNLNRKILVNQQAIVYDVTPPQQSVVLDRTAPSFFDVVDHEKNPEIKVIEFDSNENFDMHEINFTNETTFDLDKKTMILIDKNLYPLEDLEMGLAKDIEVIEYRNGDSSKKLTNSDGVVETKDVDEIIGASILSVSKVELEYNKRTDLVSDVRIVTGMDQDGDGKFDISRNIKVYISFEKSGRRAISIIQRDR